MIKSKTFLVYFLTVNGFNISKIFLVQTQYPITITILGVTAWNIGHAF